MSGGKGGRKNTEQVNSIPGYIEGASRANLNRADQIAALGPVRNYGPTVAGFNPTQEAGFQNTADAASAFGLAAPSNPMAGMPEAQDFGGISGYSAAPVVDNSLNELFDRNPGQAMYLASMMMDPVTGAAPQNQIFQPQNSGIFQTLEDEVNARRIG